MMKFQELSEEHRSLLAEALTASKSSARLLDDSGACLCSDGRYCSGQIVGDGDVVIRDLDAVAKQMGLDLQLLDHAKIILGLRNAVRRQDQGETWLPSMAVKLVRKEYHITLAPSRDGKALGSMDAAVTPKDLIMASVPVSPKKRLIVHLDWDAFVDMLRTRPATADWRRWLHSRHIKFEQEPLWLKLMLKLF